MQWLLKSVEMFYTDIPFAMQLKYELTFKLRGDLILSSTMKVYLYPFTWELCLVFSRCFSKSELAFLFIKGRRKSSIDLNQNQYFDINFPEINRSFLNENVICHENIGLDVHNGPTLHGPWVSWKCDITDIFLALECVSRAKTCISLSLPLRIPDVRFTIQGANNQRSPM